jgi:hypothetical protein
MKVIAEPSYYELHIRPLKVGERGQKFNGAGGVFSNRTNVFQNLDSCLRHLQNKNFDDAICIHASLETELDGLVDVENYPRSESKEWVFYQ